MPCKALFSQVKLLSSEMDSVLIFPFPDLRRYRGLRTVSSLSRERAIEVSRWLETARILLIQVYIEADYPLIAVCT